MQVPCDNNYKILLRKNYWKFLSNMEKYILYYTDWEIGIYSVIYPNHVWIMYMLRNMSSRKHIRISH